MDEESPTTVRVKALCFKLIPEDQADCSMSDKQEDEIVADRKMEVQKFQTHKSSNSINRNMKQNFSFEYSYPAVIFDKVCFSIDKHQQQANFLDECLSKLRDCIGSDSPDSSKEKIEILKSINLSVPYGSIFGLLGPSSCGKTTLLRCLVGLLIPNSGNIRLFCDCSAEFDENSNESNSCCGCGASSNSLRRNRCKVPGPNVGYMPQDLGLYEDFTIRQLLTMFGQYMRMGPKLIASRIEFMVRFLDLPQVDREVSSLSGGQKRRVSFAIALLHMPPLIILDEPTVGVDPLLRKSIWKYLRRLADEENKTIIITTHYIEEAAQADQVALMRAGEILVQDTPSRIMETHNCRTLEEAFLKICNNVQQNGNIIPISQRYKLYPQPKFNWQREIKTIDRNGISYDSYSTKPAAITRNSVAIKAKAIERLVVNGLKANVIEAAQNCDLHNVKLEDKINKFSMEPNNMVGFHSSMKMKRPFHSGIETGSSCKLWRRSNSLGGNMKMSKINSRLKSPKKSKKLVINADAHDSEEDDNDDAIRNDKKYNSIIGSHKDFKLKQKLNSNQSQLYRRIIKNLTLIWALLYKNYRRNVNSLPLLAFQFMLPVIQMISFSLCVGGRPTNIGLGLVNHDQPLAQYNRSHLLVPTISPFINATNVSLILNEEDLMTLAPNDEELLSDRYLSFVDQSMISIKYYDNLQDALRDVRRAKLWAAMEISENFTTAIMRRFDLENFYQLDVGTIKQSVIRLYPDRSNKVLDMICHRSLVNSYRQFLLDTFEHFRKLPIEVKEPIFSIKPNLISNSIDGYTESIAAGLLASLTYIMAAGLTTFIMVVERSAGILERTFTSGINPVAYLIAHAAFRSLVMMLQIAVVLFLTFYILQQPLVGSIWLAYLMLMTLNLTGIAYGLLISSIVTDQNGAALTIVSSLVVKITLSGILWPFEAIPRWLRTICYIQPLTMPIQALKSVTLKGAGLEDRAVQLGFLVSIIWLLIFLTISAKRFKFYQH